MLQQAAAIASGVTAAALRAARGMYEANQYVARTIDIVRPISAEAVARAEKFKATALGDLLTEKQLQQLAQAQINLRDFAGGVIDSITSGVVTGAFGSNVDARAYTVGTFAGAVGMAVVEFMVFRTCTPGTLARIARIGFQIYNAASIGIGVGRAIDNIIHDRAGVGDYLAFVPLLGAALGKYFRACLEAGTQVIVGVDENGEAVTRNIEDIREGDYVLAGDENDPSAPPTLRRVTQVFIKTTHELRVLSFVGADGATTTLNTTDEHPFFVVNRGWTRADQLQIGDTLLQPDGSFVTLTASQIEARSQGVTVYNLEVEGGHTYFVDDATSGAAVWVHNLYGKALRQLGVSREAKALKVLKAKYPNAQIYRERMLRDKKGAKLISKDGTGRRLDFVVVENSKVKALVEVTGKDVDKTAALAKTRELVSKKAYIRVPGTTQYLLIPNRMVESIMKFD